jgi:hypothetical protein
VARTELTRLFNDLAPATREQLETSLMRQWLTYEGKAGLITQVQNAWFELTKRGDGFEVARSLCDSRVASMLRQHGADAGEFPELFHRVNLSQSAEFVGSGGKTYRLSIDPRERRVTVREVTEDGDE